MQSLPRETPSVQTIVPMRALLELGSLSDFLWESHYEGRERLAILQSAQRHYSLVPAAKAGMLDREGNLAVAAAILAEANTCLGPPTDEELAAYWPGETS